MDPHHQLSTELHSCVFWWSLRVDSHLKVAVNISSFKLRIRKRNSRKTFITPPQTQGVLFSALEYSLWVRTKLSCYLTRLEVMVARPPPAGLIALPNGSKII